MNLLPLPSQKDLQPTQTIEQQQKAERIAFHRRQVRTGPVKFKTQTEGQARRQAMRSQATENRKQIKTRRRRHFQLQMEAMVMRGLLQAVGVIPYVDEGRLQSVQSFEAAERSLAAMFPLERDEPILAAIRRYAAVTGASESERAEMIAAAS